MERTKSRTRDLMASQFIQSGWKGDRMQTGYSAQGALRVRRSEQIAYDVGAKFNSCNHTKSQVALNGRPSTVACPSPLTDWFVEPGDPSTGSYPEVTPMPSSQPLIALRPTGVYASTLRLDTTRVENAKLDAYNKLIHLQPDRHMNVDQAVMELKDTKQTLNGVVSFLNWAKAHIGRRTPIGRKTSRLLGLGSRVADFASAYLWYQFGIEPTVQDVRKFLDELSKGKLRVRPTGQKPRRYEKGTVVSQRYVVRPPETEILDLMFPSLNSSTSHEYDVSSATYVGVAGALAADNLPQIGKVVPVEELYGCYFAEISSSFEISEGEDLKRRWEWNCPSFRTLWELTPFSFLVDWFVDVGRTIERLEKRYVSPSYSSHFGPIWAAERLTVREYLPGLSSLTGTCAPVAPAAPPNYGGRVVVKATWRPRVVKGFTNTVTFHRGPTSKPAVAIPEIKLGEVKAYQITSGMALILQAAKQWFAR